MTIDTNTDLDVNVATSPEEMEEGVVYDAPSPSKGKKGKASSKSVATGDDRVKYTLVLRDGVTPTKDRSLARGQLIRFPNTTFDVKYMLPEIVDVLVEEHPEIIPVVMGFHEAMKLQARNVNPLRGKAVPEGISKEDLENFSDDAADKVQGWIDTLLLEAKWGVKAERRTKVEVLAECILEFKKEEITPEAVAKKMEHLKGFEKPGDDQPRMWHIERSKNPSHMAVMELYKSKTSRGKKEVEVSEDIEL